MKNRAGNDQYLLGAWESARRVERKAVRSKGGSTPAAAPEEPHPVTPAPPAAAQAPQPAAMAPATPAKVA